MLICFLNQNAIYLKCVRSIPPLPLKEKSPSLFSRKTQVVRIKQNVPEILERS